MNNEQIIACLEAQKDVNEELVKYIDNQSKKINVLQTEINSMNKRFDKLDKIIFSLSELVLEKKIKQ